MSDEILINITPQETRVALLENGVTQEIQIERASHHGLVGNIYKGCVSRVMPGMDAAFIDIGLEKAAFIHASEVVRVSKNSHNEINGSPTRNHEDIANLLHEGQHLLVQVVKDQLGTKGARLTTNITIPSRYLVLVPYASEVRISARIENEQERERLTQEVESIIHEAGVSCGCIVRTVAEAVTIDELKKDFQFLQTLWQTIAEKIQTLPAISEVYSDLPLAIRILRDLSTENVDKIRVDSRSSYRMAADFAQRLFPELMGKIEFYGGDRPLFDLYSVEDEIKKALDRKVLLKSGGYLIFDQTEAMTTIDVNTGAYIGRRNLAETIFKTNLEATQAIARQLRLRNLGGIIIIDFIDMEDEEHKRQVMRVFAKALEKDRVKTQLCEVSSLGLIEMTRKRTRESLEHLLCEPCPTCNGRGSIKTAETVCFELFREVLREARQYDTEELLVLACPSVIDLLLVENSTSLAQLEEFTGKAIKLQVEDFYKQEQFDVVPI